MRISDWSTDVCSSDLKVEGYAQGLVGNYDWYELEGALNVPIVEDKVAVRVAGQIRRRDGYVKGGLPGLPDGQNINNDNFRVSLLLEPTENIKNVTVYDYASADIVPISLPVDYASGRSEEHTSELKSLMRISYAVFCLKK